MAMLRKRYLHSPDVSLNPLERNGDDLRDLTSRLWEERWGESCGWRLGVHDEKLRDS
jgi:hypothetical protein